VDDFSTDDTYEIGLAYQRENGDLPITVVRQRRNLGYGGNQKFGYRWLIDHGVDVAVLLHGDGQYAPELLPEIVAPILDGRADVVLGSRMLSNGALEGGMPLYKYVGNKILTRFENAALGTRLSEFHSGYRAYRVASLDRLDLDGYSDGFDFDTEIIIGLVDAGMTIKEIPIPTYYGDEICYVNGLRYARDVTKDVLRYRAEKAGLGHPSGRMAKDEYTLKESLDGSHEAILDWMDRPPARVLDLGCSSGLLSQELRALGHYVVGVDVVTHPEVKERTDEFYEADLDHGLPTGLPTDFDVVICGDVLEHVRKPEALLPELSTVMGARGRVIASIPNFAHWYPRIRTATGRFDYDQRGILDHDHVRFFTRRSFRKLCDRSGWQVVRSRTTGVPLELLTGGGVARAAGNVERGARAVWPTMFAYQFLYELAPIAP